jgi:hypothetical protein
MHGFAAFRNAESTQAGHAEFGDGGLVVIGYAAPAK